MTQPVRIGGSFMTRGFCFLAVSCAFTGAAHGDPDDLSAHVMGVGRADCKKCHVAEVATWLKTAHFQSASERLFRFTGNTKKYANALQISQSDLITDSLCIRCHATSIRDRGRLKIDSGVSCESCHGASGGAEGWLNPHQSYHESRQIRREQETEEHRSARLRRIDDAGMIRSTNLYGLARNCFGCHVIDNEKLVAAGHKAFSAFEFVSWSGGEVRHNFFIDRNRNAEVPSLWRNNREGSPANRRRLKFVVGTLVQLESALRARSKATNPAVIPQYGGYAAAANGMLSQINAAAQTPETQAAAKTAGPLLATLFVATPNDRDTYLNAADKIATHTRAFIAAHDGGELGALDRLIEATPPHFSEQFRQKYQR